MCFVTFHFRNPLLAPGYKGIFQYYFLKLFTILLFRFKSLTPGGCDGVRLGWHPSLIFLLSSWYRAVYKYLFNKQKQILLCVQSSNFTLEGKKCKELLKLCVSTLTKLLLVYHDILEFPFLALPILGIPLT